MGAVHQINKMKPCSSAQLAIAAAFVAMETKPTGALYHIPLIPHRVLESRRSLLSSSSSRRTGDRKLEPQADAQQQIDSLYQGYGTHYLDLWVGTPPQRQTVIVGTGSATIAFPCSECTVCGELHHTDSYFIEADSSSFVKVPCGECTVGHCANSVRAPDSNLYDECRMERAYVEGSTWKAFESVDITYAGGPHDKFQALHPSGVPQTEDDIDPMRASSFAFNLTFGCQTYTTGLFATQLADGIMGMDNIRTSFWHQAHENGVIDKKSFSLCLSRQSAASWQGTEAGALTMGGVDKRLHSSPMVFSALEPGSLFVIDLRKIHLRQGGGGDSAKSSDPALTILSFNYTGRAGEEKSRGKKVAIDSGTTDTYLTKELAPAFHQAWEKLTGKPYSHSPVSLTEEELNNLPTILFQLAGDKEKNGKLKGADQNPDQVVGLAGSLDPDHPLDVIVAMPPSHYMEFDKIYGKYVARFYMNEMFDPIIGANAMMGHDINFDEDNHHIGWAESHCDYTDLVEEFEEEELAEELPKPGAEPKVDWEESKSEEDVQATGIGAVGVSKSCGSITCRGGVFVALVGVAVAGMLVWKRFHPISEAQYQPTGVEIPEMEVPDWPTQGDGDGTNYSAPSVGNASSEDNKRENNEVTPMELGGGKNEENPPEIA